MHANGHNLDILIPQYPNVVFLHHIIEMNSFDYDRAAFIGTHSRSNVDSCTSHTFRTEICDVYLSETPVGEYGLTSSLLLAYGIPTVFVSGESTLLEEIHAGVQDVDYYLYTDERSKVQIMRMVDCLAASLQKSTKVVHFKNEFVYLSFRRKYYYDFLPTGMFHISDEKVRFNSIFEFFDWLFLITQLIDAGNMFYFLAKAKIQHYMIDCMTEPERLQFGAQHAELLRKRNTDLSVLEISNLLDKMRKHIFLYKQEELP